MWCSAFSLALEPPVRFKQPLIDLEVWERDLAVLECEVPEDSVPITWYLEDRRLQPGAKYGMEEWGTKRRLTIRDIGIDDDGIYLCEMPDGGRSIAEVAVKGKRDEILKHYLGVYTDMSVIKQSMVLYMDYVGPTHNAVFIYYIIIIVNIIMTLFTLFTFFTMLTIIHDMTLWKNPPTFPFCSLFVIGPELKF